MGSPVSLDRVPNSTRKEEQQAVQVMGVSAAGTPYRRLMVPKGSPVGVENATQTQPMDQEFRGPYLQRAISVLYKALQEKYLANSFHNIKDNDK